MAITAAITMAAASADQQFHAERRQRKAEKQQERIQDAEQKRALAEQGRQREAARDETYAAQRKKPVIQDMSADTMMTSGGMGTGTTSGGTSRSSMLGGY